MRRIIKKGFVFFILLTVITLSTLFILPSMLFADTEFSAYFPVGSSENSWTWSAPDGGLISHATAHNNLGGSSTHWVLIIGGVWYPSGPIENGTVRFEGLGTNTLTMTIYDDDISGDDGIRDFWLTGITYYYVVSDQIEENDDSNGESSSLNVAKEATEPAPWVRNHEMQCWQVWVNEDNAFEFVFVWEYKDNNHVQIFDMAGNLVFETDMEKGHAHFTADLPEGMYTVKTFHEAGHILQEFVIGKP